jgi:probable GMP synthase [glutamine-hydrolyzing]
MTDKLKFVIVCYEELPEKEIGFIKKILKKFKKFEVNCLEYKRFSDCEIKLVKKLTDYCNESDKPVSGRDNKSYKASYPLSLQSVIRNLGYEVEEGIILASADNCNEQLLNLGLTTVIYDESLGKNLPYGFDLIVESFEEVEADFLIKLWHHKNGIPCTVAETERTIIRELCKKDIDEVIKISRQEHILKFVEDGRLPENEQREKLLAYMKNVYKFYDFGIWGIFEKKTGILIGVISLDLLKTTENAEYEVGFFIRKEKLGLGFGKETLDAVVHYAKSKLEALSLIAVTDKDNIEAVKLLEKCGFREASGNDKRIFINLLKV